MVRNLFAEFDRAMRATGTGAVSDVDTRVARNNPSQRGADSAKLDHWLACGVIHTPCAVPSLTVQDNLN